jgi:putative hydrolase of the HAD superfamily
VVLHPNWERVAATLGRHGVAVEASALRAADPRVRHALDVPATVRSTTDASRARSFFGDVLALAGVAPSPGVAAAFAELAEYQARHNLWEHVPSEVPPALRRLREMGLRLALVSNANGTLKRKLATTGLDGHFEVVLDSHEEGFEKPDPRLFRLALDRLGVAPAAAFHVGDLYEVDVVGARAAGLRAVLLDEAGLYAGRDCPRVGSLAELAEGIASGALLR